MPSPKERVSKEVAQLHAEEKRIFQDLENKKAAEVALRRQEKDDVETTRRREVESHPDYDILVNALENSGLREMLEHYYQQYPETTYKVKKKIFGGAKKEWKSKTFQLTCHTVVDGDKLISYLEVYRNFKARFEFQSRRLSITVFDSYSETLGYGDNYVHYPKNFFFESVENLIQFIARRIAQNKPFSPIS